MLRKYEWNMQDVWDTIKRPNLQIMGLEEGEEIQTKGIDKLFNNKTLRKGGTSRYRRFMENQTIRMRKETSPDIS
jgi:hypothetical protein